MIIIIKILKKVSDEPSIAKDEKFIQTYGPLVQGLNIKKNCSLITNYWFAINLFRWAITVCILVLLKDFGQF